MLELKNVSYIYSQNTPFEKTAIVDVDLIVKKGEILGIIGETGSGKSTLIQVMCGLFLPCKGEVLYRGEALQKVSPEIGIVFQYPENQIFEETVRQELEFGPKNLKFDKEKIAESVKNAASIMGITEEMMEKSPFELSGGQKRRVAIASILAMNPRVLIFDEPTAGLDAETSQKFFKLLKNLNNSGVTIVYVSHSMDDIACVADRIAMLKDGKIEKIGTTKEVFVYNARHNPKNIPQISKVLLGVGFEGEKAAVWEVRHAAELIKEFAKRTK